jgi:hypothetical protein
MKPPVVVIERHCKANQCWIAVRCKKIQSVAKISQSAAENRADDAFKTSSTGARRRKIFSSCVRAPFSEIFVLARAVVFYFGDGW